MSHARSKARRCGVQALYQLLVGGGVGPDAAAEFGDVWGLGKADKAYFRELVTEVSIQRQQLDRLIQPFLDRSVEALDPIERCVLWLGAYELQSRRDIPYRVILSEAIELAKSFGADQGHTYVNAILDKVAHQVRELEIAESH